MGGVGIYLDGGLRRSAEAGQHNFIAKVENVLRRAGHGVSFRPVDAVAADVRRGREYALFHMIGPPLDRALFFRRVYHYPFWAIEPSPERWQWHVARSAFRPDDVPRKEADRFYRFWQKRLFGQAPQNITREGFVLAPLQGRLLERRSFQTCSPIDMLRAVLRHDPSRPVVATLHPKEQYSQPELAALDRLAQEYPRLKVRKGGSGALLAGCDYIVTQNSAVAFDGMFFAKPAALFGRIDFHHVSANAAGLGAGEAIRQAPDLRPDYAGYIHWFWQIMSINAGREDAEQKIRAAFARAGWPVK